MNDNQPHQQIPQQIRDHYGLKHNEFTQQLLATFPDDVKVRKEDSARLRDRLQQIFRGVKP